MRQSRDKIPYLTAKKIKGGKTAYYFNLPKRLIPEGCDMKQSYALGCDYFSACEQAIKLNRQLNDFRKYKENLREKSLMFVWTNYKESRLYKKLSERTAKSYEYVIERLCKIKSGNSGTAFKDIPLDKFDYDSAYNLYEKFIGLFKQYQAMYCITVLRLLYNFGLNKGYFTQKNPFENLRITKPKPQKKIIPADHIRLLISKATELGYTFVALAIELNFYLAQRPADVLKLRKQHIYKKGNNYFFDIIQNKTGKEVRLPIPPHLIDKVLAQEDYIICDDYGNFTVERFSDYFKKVRDALGFDYVFKNMRHTASTAYAEAGVTSTAAISITGHTNEKIFNEVYKANTDTLSLRALNKRLKAESQNGEKKESE
nr:MAG TPA: Integrase [Bacteriophage sp.]